MACFVYFCSYEFVNLCLYPQLVRYVMSCLMCFTKVFLFYKGWCSFEDVVSCMRPFSPKAFVIGPLKFQKEDWV